MPISFTLPSSTPKSLLMSSKSKSSNAYSSPSNSNFVPFFLPCAFKSLTFLANALPSSTSASSTKPLPLANSIILCKPSDCCIVSKNFSLADFSSPILALGNISIIRFSAFASPTLTSTSSPSSVLTEFNGFLISSPSFDISSLSIILPS